VSEWLDLLIEEIDRKKRELDEAREESARRDTSAPVRRDEGGAQPVRDTNQPK
jgi:hypothetical protein